MLVRDLKPALRDTAIQEALVRSRRWWHGSPDGSFAHAVWIQLLKDISRKGEGGRDENVQREVKDALNDWAYEGELWYVEGHGVDRTFLNRMMREWCFIGEGRDLPIDDSKDYYIVDEGTRVCSRCKKEHHISQYHRSISGREGRLAMCKYCRKHGEAR
jgi:hypothetical protein